MDESLLAAYRQTDYRVRLASGGYASIRIGAVLPEPLRVLSGQDPWAVITAWHPRSRRQPRSDNRMAQRTLLAALRALPETRRVCAAVGVGADGDWREPSLWVVGLPEQAVRALCVRHDQHAWVMGDPQHVASLCWTAPGQAL